MTRRTIGGPLTDKQRAFCAEYLVDLNATAAAKRAGYSAKTAKSTGFQNMERADVRAEIQRLMDERSQRTDVTIDSVIREVARLAFSDVRKLFDDKGAMLPISEWPDGMAAAVASVEVDELFEGFGENRIQVGYTKKVKIWDKPKSLEMLGKHLRLWVEKVEHTGPNGGPIQTRDDGLDLSMLTDAELAQLEQITQAADARRAER